MSIYTRRLKYLKEFFINTVYSWLILVNVVETRPFDIPVFKIFKFRLLILPTTYHLWCNIFLMTFWRGKYMAPFLMILTTIFKETDLYSSNVWSWFHKFEYVKTWSKTWLKTRVFCMFLKTYKKQLKTYVFCMFLKHTKNILKRVFFACF